MKKIKIAQIGIGHDHAGVTLDSLLRQSDIFDVVGYAVCGGEEEQFAQKVKNESCFSRAERMTVDEILAAPGLEAVAVESQEVLLTKYSLMAAEKGLHIQMDKPGSEDPDDYEKLVRMMKRKGLVFHLGYMYRYNPAVMRTMELVRSGRLGEIYSVETHMDCFYQADKRQWLDAFRGGMMFYLGCHLVDLIVLMQGVPEEVVAMNMPTGFDGVTANDYGMAVLKYKNGISFAKTCMAEPGGFMRRQCVVCGENGTVELKPLERYIRHADGPENMMTGMKEIYRDEAVQGGWNMWPDIKELGPCNRYDAMLAAFAAMARGERENPYTYEYELRLHRIVLAACGFDIDYKAKIEL